MISILRLQDSKIKHNLERNINWSLFLKLIESHELSPLIYHNLKKYYKLIPTRLFQHLEEIYEMNLTRNLILWDEFIKIQEILHS